MIIALIVAAGKGERYNASQPKQYDDFDNSNILVTTINRFIACEAIDKIQVVINQDHVGLYNKAIEDVADIAKLNMPIFGGATRQKSVKKGLDAIAKLNPKYVLIHDAVRPNISREIISNIIDELKHNLAVIPVSKISSTVKECSGDLIIKTHDRNKMFLAQTPQGFDYKKICLLHDKYSDADVTDDAGLFELDKLPVKIIEGCEDNVKITYKSDVSKNLNIVGMGFDAHRFDVNATGDNYIMMGGVKLPCLYPIIAHSDGDVLLHALVDAMLGCVGEGDIGQHFPPSDDKFKNMDSVIFVKKALDILQQKQAKLINIDVTIISEIPKICRYREQIRNNLADILNMAAEYVNIKATTTEKMGFTGRKEGIAAQVIISAIRKI
jgi:2-C-methyl-D-erythritol 4-phosphate cytidylyltransferase / 2-C-methyl-D-erythritol 2,4-cyclodiphosphate synthase